MDERLNDSDFQECLKYAPFKLEEVDSILACWPGAADEEYWEYIVKLKDGNYGWVNGGCDYTGWGCQESGEGGVATSTESAILLAPEKKRENLRKQVDGSAPYGLR